MFYPDYATSECNKKLLSEFESFEGDEIFASLLECCNDKFPNSLSTCCDTPGSGGCTMSGITKWLPDWANNQCYEKDTALIESWEQRWMHDEVENCCSQCTFIYISKTAPCQVHISQINPYFSQTLAQCQAVTGDISWNSGTMLILTNVQLNH